MTEIIVYRNPLEAALWQMIMGADFIPVLAGIAVFFAVFLTLYHILSNRFGSWGKTGKQITYFSLSVGVILGVTVVRLMLL